MSLHAQIWALESDTKPSARKFLLFALANFATERNKSYPTVAALCKMTAQNAATVEAGLEGLIADGRISDTLQRVGNEKEIRVFQLNCETVQPTQEKLLAVPKKKKLSSNPALAEAQQVYEIYPRKIAPQKAIQAIAKAIKMFSLEIVMNGTKNFAEAFNASGKEKAFCPHPATFFNQERFNASLEDLGFPMKPNGAPKIVSAGPTHAEFMAYAKEKFGDIQQWQNWAEGFFNHQSKPYLNWRHKGTPIDWKIKFSEHVSSARRAVEAVELRKAQRENRQ